MLLLDTCCLLWLASDQSKLSARARDLIAENAGELFISAISAFEIAVKHREGRLTLPLAPEKWIEEALDFHGVLEIPVSWRIAARSTALSLPHPDPCDRMIMATAEIEHLPLLSPDALLRGHRGVKVEW